MATRPQSPQGEEALPNNAEGNHSEASDDIQSTNGIQSPDGDELLDDNGPTDGSQSPVRGSQEQMDSSYNMFGTIRRLSRRARALEGLDQYCEMLRPYGRHELQSLRTFLGGGLNKVAPLKGARARYVPQWDQQVNSSRVPDNVDYQNPPDPDHSLLHFKDCSVHFKDDRGKHCDGLTWIFTPRIGTTFMHHPLHDSFPSQHEPDCFRASAVVEISSVYRGEKDGLPPRMGIGVAFSPDSNHNLKAHDLNEIYYPAVGGKRAEGPPSGHRQHGLRVNDGVGDISAALIALRVIERKIYPLHLYEALDYYGSSGKVKGKFWVTTVEDEKFLTNCGPFRVILKTHSKQLMMTMCKDVEVWNKVAREEYQQYPGTDQGREDRAKACGYDKWEYKTRKGHVVRNSAAICALDAQIERLANFGIAVQFYYVDKQAVPNADELAKEALAESTEYMLRREQAWDEVQRKALELWEEEGFQDGQRMVIDGERLVFFRAESQEENQEEAE